jgi:hypothetical protein
MPNDILGLWSPPRRAARALREAAELTRCVRGVLFALVACAALPACAEEDDGVTFGDEIRPLFNRRCTTCHRTGTPIQVDIQNPFAPVTGLVNSRNSWNDAHPGETPEFNVVPFEPENSFLIDKLVGESALPSVASGGHGGAPMPAQIPPLTATELAAFETWVAQGARNDASFLPVQAVIGPPDAIEGKCMYCHYEGTPNPPNLADPFGPQGLVNVKAIYRADMVRVLPGQPEESLLILKVRANRPESDIGAQMPYSYPALTTRQIDTVRQWILEGARP